MTQAETVAAVLLHYVGADLHRYDTRTAPAMLSPVDEALDNLRQFKAAMVAAGDVDDVLAQVNGEQRESVG